MLSVSELFKVGRGPSSSHTIGPMRGCQFMLDKYNHLPIAKVKATLFGSFALTGKGHQTDRAIKLMFAKYPTEIVWDLKTSTEHPNTFDITLLDAKGKELVTRRIVSVGGGTINILGEPPLRDFYQYQNFDEMKRILLRRNISAFDFLCEHEDKKMLTKLFDDMIDSFLGTIKEGLNKTGQISGPLGFDRRGKAIFDSIKKTDSDLDKRIKLVSAYAMATMEEATSFGLVVTTPTCGSCGIMPAVFKYAYDKYKPTKKQIYEALAAASLIGITIKQNGSVAGATGGCQAEVGVATCLAAAMYAVMVFDAKPNEWETAAEHAFQQCLGLTCDPVGGGVLVPCIQRNAVYANRAIDAAELAHTLRNTRQLVKIDDTIAGAFESGNDLKPGYRETSLKGLAFYCDYVQHVRTPEEIEKYKK